ncbi:MAG: SOS response-associated peptidase [Acetobacteraceae bacterium]
MCGRFSQALPAELLARLFQAEDRRFAMPEPSWNVAPSQSVAVAAWDPQRRRRVLTQMEWGLLAPWERHPDTARIRPINARCETVVSSKLFRHAFQKRRCLVPIDAWFEWQKAEGRKIPHALARADHTPAVLGGIWECWRNPIGDRTLTLAIVTTPAAEEWAGIHDRMPLVLEEADWPTWLGEAEGDSAHPDGPAALMRPAEQGRIVAWRVGAAVGNPRNNGAQLLEAA